MNLFKILLLILWIILFLSWIVTGSSNDDLFFGIVAISVVFVFSGLCTLIKIFLHILKKEFHLVYSERSER